MNPAINYQININGNLINTLNKINLGFTQITEPMAQVEDSISKMAGGADRSLQSIPFSSIIAKVEQVANVFASVSAPGIEFEQSMADLSAATGISGEELDRLGQTAQRTGKQSGLGANQAAKAFTLLASQIDVSKMGIDGLELLQQNSITLARAMGMSMDDAANSVAGTINQFGLAAGDAGRVINVLAAGSKYGAAQIGDLTSSLRVVGTAANAAGLTVEQTAGAIEVLSKNNLKGAEAGAALRNIMDKMQTTLGVDFSKNSLSEALDALSPKLNDAAYLSQVFGTENMAAAQFLISNSEAVKEMTLRMTDTNVAQEQAATRTQTTQAMMERCRATIDNLKIGFFDILGPMGGYLAILAEQSAIILELLPLISMLTTSIKVNSIWTSITGMATKLFGKSAKKAAAEVTYMGVSVAGAGAILKIYGMIAGFQAVANYALAKSFKAIGKAIMAIPVVGWILAIVSAIIALVAWLWENSKIFNEFIGGIVGYFKYLFELTVKLWSWIWDGIVGFITGVSQWVSSFVGGAWDGICAIFSNIGQFLSAVWGNIADFFATIGSWLEQTVGGIWSSITGIFTNVINWFKSIFSSVGEWFTGVFDKAISKISQIIKPIADFLGGLFGGMKDSIVSEAQKFGDNYDKRKGKDRTEEQSTGDFIDVESMDFGQVNSNESGNIPLNIELSKRGINGGVRGNYGSNSGIIDLDKINTGVKGSAPYNAIVSKLSAAKVPGLATATASVVMPLAMASVTPGAQSSPESLLGGSTTINTTATAIDHQSHNNESKMVRPDKFCDQVVINIASADGKGHDTIRGEIVNLLDQIMNDYDS